MRLDFENEKVTLEDELDTSDTGSLVLSLAEFTAALSNYNLRG